MKLSPRGAAAIALSEGNITRAYRCPAKVITIGIGYTNRSRAFKAYWMKTRGHALRMGDTISKAEALKILPDICAEEYGKAVNKALNGKKVPQHVYDACVSVTFNCGAGCLRWTWFKLGVLKGDYREAARRLRTTATKAGGRVLRGLVTRRAHEALMLKKGHYGKASKAIPTSTKRAPKQPNDTVKEFQAKLNFLGYRCSADGWLGLNTARALKAFQKANGDLKVDGRFGPASYAAIDRVVKAKRNAVISASKPSAPTPAVGKPSPPPEKPKPQEPKKKGVFSRWFGR